MAFETVDQFHAAMMEEQRAQTALLRDILDALGELHMRGAVNGHAAQLPLAPPAGGSNGNGRGNGKGEEVVRDVRRDFFGQELPRGISWDASGRVWQVDVTLPGRPRRRIRIPVDRFMGRPAAGLAEACHVRAVLQGIDVKANLATMHPETARDVAAEMAKA